MTMAHSVFSPRGSGVAASDRRGRIIGHVPRSLPIDCGIITRCRQGGDRMTYRSLVSGRTLAIAIIISAVASGSVAGQAQREPAKAAATPWTQGTTPDGQPDLQGIWLYF